MDNYTYEDFEKALKTMASMISRSEKVQTKLKEGSPQASLTRNRLKALYLSSSLILKELNGNVTMDNFSKEDLEKALPPIISTMNKCIKVREKLKEGNPQLSLTMNMITSLEIASSLIKKELNKRG
ncbi:MAG: hypothetical protein K0S47_2730 [Herbinix sp.]|jgi:hypothetical protein|nr:hypothetical protein [Herbinix sp.]